MCRKCPSYGNGALAPASERLGSVILYDLICDKDHDFEVWFRDSDTCAAQLAAKAVPCPTCGSSKVSKALMAPNVSAKSAGRGKPRRVAASGPHADQGSHGDGGGR